MTNTPPAGGGETEPSWRPDPTGRHELRWHDGLSFTDRVADGGVQATDAGEAAPPPVPEAPSSSAPPTSTWVQPDTSAWPAPTPLAPVTPTRRRNPVPVALAVAGGLAIVGGGAYLLLRGGDPAGEGTFSGTVGGDVVAGLHTVRVPAGSVAIVRVTPSADFDAVVGFAVDDELGSEIDDLFATTPFAAQAEDLDLDDAFALQDGESIDVADGQRAVFTLDVGFPGEAEQTFVAAPFAIDATVVVTGFVDTGERSSGDYEITIDIEAIDLGADEAPTGDDVLDAIVADDGVPDSLADIIRGTVDPD